MNETLKHDDLASRVHMCWMVSSDMPSVLKIESEAFGDSWSKEDFVQVLVGDNCIGMVVESKDKVVGYMIYVLHKCKIYLMNFAVANTHRRTGIATRMVNELKSKLSQRRRTFITLEVVEANLPAQLFFRSCGFEAISVLKNHYGERDSRDAYLMQYKLPRQVTPSIPK